MLHLSGCVSAFHVYNVEDGAGCAMRGVGRMYQNFVVMPCLAPPSSPDVSLLRFSSDAR